MISTGELAQAAAGDCEQILDGFFGQPINTWSSFAYVVVGGIVAARAVRAGGRRTLVRVAYAITLAGIGLGSVVFHGPMPGWAKIAHDLPITALAFLVIA